MSYYIDDVALFKLIRNPDYSERARKYLDSIFDYARCVMEYPVKVESSRSCIDPTDPRVMQRELEAIDAERTRKHDKAISSLSILNRMAERAAMSPIYIGDIASDSRKDVAHAIFRLCEDILIHSHEGWQKTKGERWVKQ